MAMFNVDVVDRLAREYGYTKCQYDPRQGLSAYRRATTCDGTPEIARVWCGTRTVETQLKHPNRPARTALFRRNVPHYKALGAIFDNPRAHTGTGYYRDPEKDTPCPGCGKHFRGVIGSVCHYECGKCKSNPCASSARRTAYEVARRAGADFLVERIAYREYATDSDDEGYHETDGYESDGYNYRCNACGKEFKLLNALMQHQKNRSQCQHLVSQSSRYMLSA
jgi:predicted nucleic acid-binding Zn ribbon protein